MIPEEKETRPALSVCTGCSTEVVYRFECVKCRRLFCGKCLLHEPGPEMCVECQSTFDTTEYKIQIRSVEAWGTPIDDDVVDRPPQKNAGLLICWIAEGVGFGELTIFIKDGVWCVDTESMSNRFVAAVLSSFQKGLVRKG